MASASRAALSAACVIGFALTAQARGAAVAAESLALREKDVRRAEKVLAKLRLLDEAAAAREDAGALRDLSSKLYPGLFISVGDMHNSDLKTDLGTAVFLYEEVGRTWRTAGDSTADCAREKRDIYLPLCLDLRGGTVRQLLVSKARLHTRWAEAVVKNYRGEGDAETLRALNAMRAARASDLEIAARVVGTLKTLERLVNTVPAYAGNRGSNHASGVGFDQMDREFGDALRSAGAQLASMPRSPAFYNLSNAWRSYKDGRFWYRKVHQSKKLVVSAHGFERDPLKDLRLDSDQVTNTVIANWQAAVKYTRLAEQSLSRPY